MTDSKCLNFRLLEKYEWHVGMQKKKTEKKNWISTLENKFNWYDQSSMVFEFSRLDETSN